MAGLTEETGHELLEALGELRAELRRIRHDGLIARLSPAERHAIATEVFEMVDERMAPADLQAGDDAPGRAGGRGRYFKNRG